MIESRASSSIPLDASLWLQLLWEFKGALHAPISADVAGWTHLLDISAYSGVGEGVLAQWHVCAIQAPTRACCFIPGECSHSRHQCSNNSVMSAGVTVTRSTGVKDELVLQGNDIEEVSKSAALINYQCHVRNKDIRKFLDGIYISERGHVVKAEN